MRDLTQDEGDFLIRRVVTLREKYKRHNKIKSKDLIEGYITLEDPKNIYKRMDMINVLNKDNYKNIIVVGYNVLNEFLDNHNFIFHKYVSCYSHDIRRMTFILRLQTNYRIKKFNKIKHIFNKLPNDLLKYELLPYIMNRRPLKEYLNLSDDHIIL